MAQWVKHLTAAVWMAEELWVRFLAQSGGLKGSSASLLRLGINPLPRNFAGATIKFKKKQTTKKKDSRPGTGKPCWCEAGFSLTLRTTTGIASNEFLLMYFFSFLFVFLLFIGPLAWHMEVPRLGVESEL